VLGRLKGRWRRRLIASFPIALAFALVAASVLRGAHEAVANSPSPLLPNLVADPPDNISQETSYTEGGLKQEGEAELLLRFNGYVHNVGPGALDMRGSRQAPKVSKQTEEELKHITEKELSPQAEAELASPSMNVFQRLFTTNEGNPKKSAEYLERPHVEETSGGKMLYVSADGHHHWHLQHVAKYSLWNAAKTAEVAPAQKVGFCLEDSERRENIGPTTAVYADNVPPYRRFCQEYRPDATSLYEGISPGWRDLYESNLAFQWVDVSDVLPGEYWLREDVNPEGVIKETGGGNKIEYAKNSTIVPGFDALPQAAETPEGQPKALTLGSTAWEEKGIAPRYQIVSQPEHGTLQPIVGDGVTYVPAAGYSGADRFTFLAGDPNSPFPRHPAIATVSLNVVGSQHQQPPAPSVQIAGAPASMVAGTSVQLTAATSDDGSGVTWYASAGSITAGGLYTAPPQPPAGGSVTIVASLADGAAVDTRTIAITPVPTPEPAPAAAQSGVQASRNVGPGASAEPGSGSDPGLHGRLLPVTMPRATRVGDELVMTTYASAAGRVRLSAFVGAYRLVSCVSRTPAHRAFTCRLRLPRWTTARTRIAVIASMRVGDHIYSQERAPAAVAAMRMRTTVRARTAAAFFCGF
jgi:hypothetical protein